MLLLVGFAEELTFHIIYMPDLVLINTNYANYFGAGCGQVACSSPGGSTFLIINEGGHAYRGLNNNEHNFHKKVDILLINYFYIYLHSTFLFSLMPFFLRK